MIAVDTNIPVRYLVCDDQQQAEAARTPLESLAAERPGFICREVMEELVCVLERAYGFSRHRIANVVEKLVSTEGLVLEAQDNVPRSAIGRSARDFPTRWSLLPRSDQEPLCFTPSTRRPHGSRCNATSDRQDLMPL